MDCPGIFDDSNGVCFDSCFMFCDAHNTWFNNAPDDYCARWDDDFETCNNSDRCGMINPNSQGEINPATGGEIWPTCIPIPTWMNQPDDSENAPMRFANWKYNQIDPPYTRYAPLPDYVLRNITGNITGTGDIWWVRSTTDDPTLGYYTWNPTLGPTSAIDFEASGITGWDGGLDPGGPGNIGGTKKPPKSYGR